MKMSAISQRANELVDRVLSDGYQATERDVSEAQELVNQYIDELERLEQVVKVESFSDISQTIDFIISTWYPQKSLNE